MKLRTQILIVLLLFALFPIFVTVFSNLPRVLELLESYHRQLYLQGLRSDFRDLDQHLTSRQEMVKLLAKLPEPGIMLGQIEADKETSIDVARAHYTEWINRILPDQLDVIEILFLDLQGKVRFWLERDQQTHEWQPTLRTPVLPPQDLIAETLQLKRPDVFVSKVKINVSAQETDPRRIMNLRLLSPLGFLPGVGPSGVVVMSVDIGGMAQRYNDTYWAYDDGRYLEVSQQAESGATAFEDFAGLREKFATGKLTLWEGRDGRQVIWVPLMQTEASGPLWVGRTVDSTPLTDFRSQLILRVSGIVLALMLLAWLAARWFAMRADRLGRELTDGISRLLEEDEQVRFQWSWSEELRQLGDKLTRLAKKHVYNNKRLLAHTQELEASNRYKSEFLANVSHELRTPLNSILLLSKMLSDADSGLPPDSAKQASVIYHAGKDLQQLIDNILDLSRIEARSTSLNLENIQLEHLLNDLIDLMRPQFEQKGLYLKLDIDPEAPLVINSDPDKLRQILKNFLSNAVKFTDQGGVTIRLFHQTAPSNGGSLPVCISIRDTGIGIPADKQDVIFQAFKQADGSTSRRYGGTGLGLTISRQLAHLLGGDIELSSHAGGGADFRLRLPLVFDRETIVEEQLGVDEAAPQEMTEGSEALEAMDFSGLRVLLVDDDVRNLLALTPLLEKWGFEVTGAGDGHEALEALDEEPIDIVLLDIMMPEMDGYDTMSRIRQQYDCDQLPVVALTAKASEGEEQTCLESGANEYLAKPIEVNDLKRAMIRLLKHRVAE
ncbi:MAG: ATP-binding protein [Chromatiales bacterium]|jgi:signal transduction histidine kinase/ActR/RegA family two-component response regulator